MTYNWQKPDTSFVIKRIPAEPIESLPDLETLIISRIGISNELRKAKTTTERLKLRYIREDIDYLIQIA